MHCITFAFSQCFMHFRCVFYMLKSYVLIGLDWAEPMMLFCCMSHGHAFFMHTYLSFLSFLLFVNLFCVSLSLSLSLSLFLSDSLRMTPKRKTTPSRNPLHSEASSSFDSTPLHDRFCDDKAHQDFLENFSRRGIHSECQVILSDFFDTDLPTVIHSKDCESLCDILVSCPSVIK